MFQRIKKKISGSQFNILTSIIYLHRKITFNLIRGLRYSIFGNACFPFLKGSNVKILFSSKFKAGKGCYLGDFSLFNCLSKQGVVLGDNVTIREGAWVQLTSDLSHPGEFIEVGSNTYIGPKVSLGAAAPIKIGERCQIGGNVTFIAENHQFQPGLDISQQGVTREGIYIGDDCWLGNNVTILDGVTLGKGCVVGAGSVVTKSFASNAIIVGNPARLLRER